MSTKTTTFTIHRALVFSLSGGGIKHAGWEIDQDGKTHAGTFRTLNEAKAKVRRIVPDGTKISWRKNSVGRWYCIAEVHDA